MDEHPRSPKPGLFRDVVLAPDRDRDFATRPVVSVHPEDEPAYVAEVVARSLDEVSLVRRGVEHGSFAVLDPEGLLGPRLRRRRREARVRERWVAARPILLPGVLAGEAKRVKGLARGLHDRLARGEFADWLKGRERALGPRFVLEGFVDELADPDRDLALATLSSRDGLRDFWIKLGRLSTHPEDRSLRLRLSFGAEGDDDASTDEERHRALVEIARPLVPGFAGVTRDEATLATLRDLAGGDVYLTQPIGYWNVAGGGARFHHDAFSENDEQLGVLFVQLTGRSFWLALSIRDLVDRLREYVAEGDSEEELRALLGRPADALAEAALPGLGRLGAVADSPSFTCFLADAGHAAVLEPGDAILLPNHGLDRTTMHSVFGVARRPAYGLSLAVRRG